MTYKSFCLLGAVAPLGFAMSVDTFEIGALSFSIKDIGYRIKAKQLWPMNLAVICCVVLGASRVFTAPQLMFYLLPHALRVL